MIYHLISIAAAESLPPAARARRANGFKTIGGWNVPGTIPSTIPGAAKLFPTQFTNFTNFNIPRIAPYFWVGAKYAITRQLDVTTGRSSASTSTPA
jgi:hypothetical protein